VSKLLFLVVQDASKGMWLQVNMIDETETVTPVWSLSSANLQAEEWITGRVRLVSKENADRYRVSTVVCTIK